MSKLVELLSEQARRVEKRGQERNKERRGLKGVNNNNKKKHDENNQMNKDMENILFGRLNFK
jgi:hypothetical protein